MHELERAGQDNLGREVFLTYVPELTQLLHIELPSAPFVLFIGADTTDAIPQPLSQIAQVMIDASAVYVLCWGPNCDQAEEVFDEAAVGDGSVARHTVMTTSHPGESILEVLEFATSVAVPIDEFADSCQKVIVAFVGNVHWYNEGQNCLEDLLGRNAG